MKLCGCVGQGKKKPEQEKESQGGELELEMQVKEREAGEILLIETTKTMPCNAALSQRQVAIAQQQFLKPFSIPDDGTMVAWSFGARLSCPGRSRAWTDVPARKIIPRKVDSQSAGESRRSYLLSIALDTFCIFPSRHITHHLYINHVVSYSPPSRRGTFILTPAQQLNTLLML